MRRSLTARLLLLVALALTIGACTSFEIIEPLEGGVDAGDAGDGGG